MLFVGSAALAQQGLVVDPWRQASKASKPLVAPVPASRALPASGLPPPSVALPAPRQVEAPAAAPADAAKWSPPVIELLVDPWAKSDAVAAPKPRWVPQTLEIIDPWANAAPAEAPRVASRPAETAHSTIF